MDIVESMKIFKRVAELSSFVKASESLGMSKATMSNVIKNLEVHLGVRLFQRTTRKVQMTHDGLIFYERCKDLLSDVEELESLFRKDEKTLTGRIRVDMSTGFAKNLVIPALPDFLRQHPGLQVELSSTDRRVDLVREGFDCVVRVGSLVDSGLIAKPLGSFSIVNCASPEYIKAKGRPKRLEDLIDHDMIHYTQVLGGKPDGFEYKDGDTYSTVMVKGQMSVNNAENYLHGCLAGLGIVQIPKAPVLSYLKEKKLIEVLPQYTAEPMPVTLLYPNRRHIAKRTQIFMEWLQGLMKHYVQ